MHDLVYQLRQRRDGFSPVERRIADAILADIPAAAQSGVGELAARAGVSVAAVSRFAKALGCAHVRELRAGLAEAGAVGRRFLDDAGAPPLPALHTQIADDIDGVLRRNLAGFSEPVVRALAEALASARRIHVLGMGGSSAVFAQELQHRLTRLGLPAAACSDAVAMRMLAATLEPGDVVLALSVSGLNPELREALEIARGYGARVGAITRTGTPLAAQAGWLLPLALEETDFVFKPSASRYAVLLAIDVLATTVALLDPAGNRERLRRIKLALDTWRGGGDERLPLGD
ncbi:MurR/RpiR family transcriptional regulator [Pseudoxanthomonas daejeonensis]|uniref:MurR/RpiR family transcriptional regulator n=1 Tax=Pseudoxanthomonas daejeonensis TaxID=266062 RepID=A0ABQ6Z7P2_9GAMM|nr:MurR/RpiR family transcriptional regulator [Pseudoxanthomonas daejeonensis]KAF1695063.1 MurR/RpiR family transcriptional regulator [Pseudoxanthomonas daejeonensis]